MSSLMWVLVSLVQLVANPANVTCGPPRPQQVERGSVDAWRTPWIISQRDLAATANANLP
jgi:hypothetical protein